jgi:tRNA(fMet)-specific endonuclease VapC
VHEYTEATSARHARLIAHVRRAGVPQGAHDLIIAAHALQIERIVLTFDANARFGDLPGVSTTDAWPVGGLVTDAENLDPRY